MDLRTRNGIKLKNIKKYNNRVNSIHITGIKSYSDIERKKNILPLQIIKSEIHTSLSKIIYPPCYTTIHVTS